MEHHTVHSATLDPQVMPAQAPEQFWKAAGAAVRGISHERLDLPCQDVQGYRTLPNGLLLIAVADGAGSAPLSDQGARCAVDEALRALEVSLENLQPGGRPAWEQLLRDAFSAAREAVLCLAGVQPDAENDLFDEYAAAREYACTLTCVVAAADCLAVGQIGDGAVVAAGEDGLLFAATRLQRGEYANETHFLTGAEVLDPLVIEVVERPVEEIAVMSDGLIRLALKMPGQQPHAPFFQPLFRFIHAVDDEEEAVRQLAGFLSSERVNARTDDDKSLVLAVRAVTAAKESFTETRSLTEKDSPTESVESQSSQTDRMEQPSRNAEESDLDQAGE